jgi:hypothetical protein
MTKRDARKIATLFTVRKLTGRDAPSVGDLTVEEANKVQKQEERLGRKLAARYDLDISDIPVRPAEIVRRVRDGSL